MRPSAVPTRRRGLAAIAAAWAALATLGLALAACAPPQRSTRFPAPQPRAEPVLPPLPDEPPAPRGPAVVGLLLPLSGGAAQLGADFLDAAQLALFDVGGDAPLELVPRDTGDSPEQAVTAAHAAIDGGAELLLGPLFGRSTTAVAPVAAARGVSVLSFSNDASVARPGTYVLGFRPEEQVERIVAYAGRRGLSNFAALAPDDAYGALTLGAWRRAAGALPGARLVGVERYGADGRDPAAAIRALPGVAGRTEAATPGGPAAPAASAPRPPARVGSGGPLPFDSLLVADGGARLRSVAASLAFYGVDPSATRLLGTMRWEDEAALLAEPALQGAWLATWSPGAVDGFTRRFRNAYGRAPLPLAVLAYDATALASLLARSDAGGGAPGGEARRFGPEQLTDPQGFTGGSGLFRLRPGGLTEHGLAVVEVRGGRTRIVDPAPTSFPGGLASRG